MGVVERVGGCVRLLVKGCSGHVPIESPDVLSTAILTLCLPRTPSALTHRELRALPLFGDSGHGCISGGGGVSFLRVRRPGLLQELELDAQGARALATRSFLHGGAEGRTFESCRPEVSQHTETSCSHGLCRSNKGPDSGHSCRPPAVRSPPAVLLALAGRFRPLACESQDDASPPRATSSSHRKWSPGSRRRPPRW